MRGTCRLLRGAILTLGVIAGFGFRPLAAESLADRFSSRAETIRSELAEIQDELIRLPDIPKDDLGENGAYGRVFGKDSTTEDRRIDFTIRFEWPDAAPVDLVALVPARKFSASGLIPEYGFPDDFSLSLIVPSKTEPTPIGGASSTSTNPVRRGHPYVFQLESPVEATGLEIKISRVRPSPPEGVDLFLLTLAEVFCFSGDRNLMRNAEITLSSADNEATTPYWNPLFMIDGNTPLGLPEIPMPAGEIWPDIGWLSLDHPSEDVKCSVTIDLWKPMTIDGLRMFPARRPSFTDFPGFGIPKRFLIDVAKPRRSDGFETVYELSDRNLANPGSNPVTTRFAPVKARFIRLRATKLWKAFDHYPAFLAFSEIQILDGETIVSDGARVLTSESKEPIIAQAHKIWSPAALTDHHGPVGELVSRRNWLLLLDRRLALEERQHALQLELESISQRWKRNTIIVLVLIGSAGLLAAFILPFRYRILEKRRIRAIRDRIAGDLHDDVGSNLGSIQLLSEMARDKTDSREELTLIGQVAAETVTSVRDIVWLLRPRNGYRTSTISHLRDSASILLESIDWTFDADLEEFALNDEDGRHLVLFFREALHNLVRHSGARHASIRLSRKHSEIHLEIHDDGRGIPPEILERPETLRALKQRSDRLGATLEISSEPGAGTTLHLHFTPQPLDLLKSARYPFSRHPGHS